MRRGHRQEKKTQWQEHKGATVLELCVAVGLIIAVLFALQVLSMQERAQTHDLRRLADMRMLEADFEQLFRTTGGYDAAATDGCGTLEVLVSTCNFTRIGTSAADLRDPGKAAYRVTAVPTQSTYEVTFLLERTHEGITAGKHTLSPNGIR
ncbi:MAG: hypothetical protein V1778_04240 [bacterium]